MFFAENFPIQKTQRKDKTNKIKNINFPDMFHIDFLFIKTIDIKSERIDSNGKIAHQVKGRVWWDSWWVKCLLQWNKKHSLLAEKWPKYAKNIFFFKKTLLFVSLLDSCYKENYQFVFVYRFCINLFFDWGRVTVLWTPTVLQFGIICAQLRFCFH